MYKHIQADLEVNNINGIEENHITRGAEIQLPLLENVSSLGSTG